jgi:hypothetical protein
MLKNCATRGALASTMAPNVYLSRIAAKGPRTTPIGLPVSREGFIDNGMITKRDRQRTAKPRPRRHSFADKLADRVCHHTEG